MTSPFSKALRCLHNWGYLTDTRRKKALREWQEDTQALVALFEKGMDPLIARAVYNQRYSTILYQLSDEIFLRIMEVLYQDEVSFFILRQVCRRFRLLVKSPQFSNHRFAPPDGYETPNAQNMGDLFLGKMTTTSGYCLPSPPLPVETKEDAALRVKIALLLHIDSYCFSCLKVDRPERRGDPKNALGYCNFLGSCKRCITCDVNHRGPMFPKKEFLVYDDEKDIWSACIGTRGYVRLCEHQVITWTEMRVCLSTCKVKLPLNDELTSEIDMHVKTCQHVEHRRPGCLQSSPSARLFYRKAGHWRLELTWEPHSGPGAFSSYRPGKFNASQMRNLFRQYRKGVAQYIVPEIVHNVLPEMTCFRLGECNCLSYGNDDEADELFYGNEKRRVRSHLRETHTPLDALSRQCNHQQPYQASQHAHVRIEACQEAHEKGLHRSPCIVTIYKRVIEGFCPSEGSKIVPSHDWLHALDRSSYKLSSRYKAYKESCTDPSCRNGSLLSIHGCFERELNPGYGVPITEFDPMARQQAPSSKTSNHV